MELFAAITLKLPESKWGTRRGGANSNYIVMPDGRRFYFKGILRPDLGIEVRTKIQSPAFTKFTTRSQIWAWVENP